MSKEELILTLRNNLSEIFKPAGVDNWFHVKNSRLQGKTPQEVLDSPDWKRHASFLIILSEFREAMGN